MVMATGTMRLNARLYDMSLATDPLDITDPAAVNLGKVSDLIMPEFERDVRVYPQQATGSTPVDASIDGSGIIVEFGLSEYSAGVMRVLSQTMRPSGQSLNFHGPIGAGTYKLGRRLSSSQTLKLLICEPAAATTRPVLYIPRAVVRRVANLALSFAENMLDPATFEVIGLYDETIGDCFAFGDIAGIPTEEEEA